MEDAIKALEMAAGVLLAVIIMSLIAYFFSSIKNLPQEQDQSAQAEQLAKFNLEYEVYNKKAMYGVDVISCLNKAQSNNEKYAAGDRFLTGSKYGELYSINVFVKLTNGALEETLEIYHYDKNSQKIVPLFDTTELKNKAITMEAAGFKINANTYTKFTPSTPLDNYSYVLNDSNCMQNKVQYNLLSNDKILQNLIEFSSVNMRETKSNYSKDKDSLELWSSATWETALYDFKTRRFRCDEMKYEVETGRVKEIYFTEIEEPESEA